LKTRIFGRAVIARANRIVNRFASVAVRQNCQKGRPKRRCISAPTQAASSVGSMRVIPLAACSAIASTASFGAWPVIEPVSPRHRSTYSRPSTSVNRAPCASATNTG